MKVYMFHTFMDNSGRDCTHSCLLKENVCVYFELCYFKDGHH